MEKSENYSWCSSEVSQRSRQPVIRCLASRLFIFLFGWSTTFFKIMKIIITNCTWPFSIRAFLGLFSGLVSDLNQFWLLPALCLENWFESWCQHRFTKPGATPRHFSPLLLLCLLLTLLEKWKHTVYTMTWFYGDFVTCGKANSFLGLSTRSKGLDLLL